MTAAGGAGQSGVEMNAEFVHLAKVADELSAIPGMDEIVSLLHINKQAKEKV